MSQWHDFSILNAFLNAALNVSRAMKDIVNGSFGAQTIPRLIAYWWWQDCFESKCLETLASFDLNWNRLVQILTCVLWRYDFIIALVLPLNLGHSFYLWQKVHTAANTSTDMLLWACKKYCCCTYILNNPRIWHTWNHSAADPYRWSWGRWRVSEACCNCYSNALTKYLNI